MGVGAARGGFDFRLGGARLSVGDILRDRAAEEEHFLRHERHLAAQFVEAVIGGGPSVEKNGTLLRIVETEQERRDGRLARAARPDQRDDFARLRGEAQMLEHLDFGPRGIGEGDAVESDIAAKARDAGRDLERLGRLAQEFAHALGRADGALEIAVEVGEAADRSADEDGVEGESEKIAGVQRAIEQKSRAVPENDGDGREDREDDEGDQSRAGLRAVPDRFQEKGDARLVTFLLEEFVAEGLHVGDALERLRDDVGRLGQFVLRDARALAHHAADQDRADDRRREAR